MTLSIKEGAGEMKKGVAEKRGPFAVLRDLEKLLRELDAMGVKPTGYNVVNPRARKAWR